MRYQKIDPKLFIENRERLRQRLPKNSLVILNSNDILPTNADGSMLLRQNSDIFYLSGIHQEETVLILSSTWRRWLLVCKGSQHPCNNHPWLIFASPLMLDGLY